MTHIFKPTSLISGEVEVVAKVAIDSMPFVVIVTY